MWILHSMIGERIQCGGGVLKYNVRRVRLDEATP